MKHQTNIYTCPHGHETVTVDLDQGTVPFMIQCRWEGCQQAAHSSFYRVAPVPMHGWYRPGLVERLRLRFTEPATYDHVRRGGLLLRPLD